MEMLATGIVIVVFMSFMVDRIQRQLTIYLGVLTNQQAISLLSFVSKRLLNNGPFFKN